MSHFTKLICICGGNEVASAAAVRLFKSGYDVLLAVDPAENVLRYHLSLGDAIHLGQKTVEDVTAAILPEDVLADIDAERFSDPVTAAIHFLLQDRRIAVVETGELSGILEKINPPVIINAYLQRETPVTIDHAPLVIGLSPFHQPGVDCHVAVESRLNYHLGQVLTTNTPVADEELDSSFFKDPFVHCKTPVEGLWLAIKAIGDDIRYNEAIGKINEIEIRSPYDGQLWGLAHSGKFLPAKSNVALIRQGKASENYRCPGFRENAIAGGLLQAISQYGEM